MTSYVSRELLDAAIDLICQSPSVEGSVEMIVRRPAIGEREILQEAELTVEGGLLGDNWPDRWSGKAEHRQRHLDMQVTLMNSRVIDAIADGDRALWPLAGDQLFVDFDLRADNIPPGTKIQVGEAVLEVVAEPHLGCKKFMGHFGQDAVMFVNSDDVRLLNLRGVNAKVIAPGVVTNGGVISKFAPF